jgi:tetratricopeptide (TPR) repeat protein
MSLSALAWVLTRLGRPDEALADSTRAVEIFRKNSDPEAFDLGRAYLDQGEALNGLDRWAEAQVAFQNALQIFSSNVGGMHPEMGDALNGIAEAKLGLGLPKDAVPLFRDALRIRQQPNTDPALTAETEFGLARALWQSRDRTQVRRLATAALASYRRIDRAAQARVVEAWLADHRDQQN